MLCLRRLGISCAFMVVAAATHADTFSWIQWNGSSAGVATGTIATSNGTVNVTLTGNFDFLQMDYPSWDPVTTWADGTIINNKVDSNGIAHISQAGSYTLTFDKAVDHMAMGVWSLGAPGTQVIYDFDHTFTYVTGGPSAEFGGSSISVLTNHSFTGEEGNGSVIFDGPMTSLNWNIIGSENWHGFTLGLKTAQAPVPEPASMLALGAGAVALIRRKRSN